MLKLESTTLSKSEWKINLTSAEIADLTVSVAENQVIRWIDEINGNDNANDKINSIKNKIKKLKKKRKEKNAKISALYNELNKLQYIPDLVEVIMNNNKDYDRANRGFTINGITYRRFMATNGGKKKSTIIYINESIFDEINSKINNGRNPKQKIVPAKLESYRSLTFSETVPISKPKGIIVVKDCITTFRENVIEIKDIKGEAELLLQYIDDYQIEHNNSDGFGLMLPSYAAKINKELNGESEPLSGMVIRYAWTKGLLVTFDFLEFAKEKNANNFMITDVWGTPRDVRNADVIITESMLKLWDSYTSWEDYKSNCIANGFDFGVTKTCPNELERVHTSNYQFLNPYNFTETELKELCKPTVKEIKDIMSNDYRKSILYLAGENLNEDSFEKLVDNNIAKALMINPDMVNDPYIRNRISNAISKRIERAKRGKLTLNANYAMICGDPYALCQSMFGLEVTGILEKGEIYHQFWMEKGADYLACFRAPMSAKNNIRKRKLNKTATAAYWFEHIKTVCILNAWDSTAEAEDGADFDGDLFYCTDNPIILNNTEELPSIISVQAKAEKKIPKEKDIITSDKKAFSDKTGEITNTITSMFDLLRRFEPNSDEYKELQYRIMCGIHYQQGQIDKTKGAIVKEMPDYWKHLKKDGDYTDLQRAIVCDKKAYMFMYVYPKEKENYRKIKESYEKNARRKERMELTDLLKSDSPKGKQWKADFDKDSNLTDFGCTVNQIAHYFEREIGDFKSLLATKEFDYSIMKSDVEYTTAHYNAIEKIYKEFSIKEQNFMRVSRNDKMDKDDVLKERQRMIDQFTAECDKLCREDELVNIVLDMVYQKGNITKNFAWCVCGDKIIENLLKANNNTYYIPVKADDGDFEFNGNNYRMIERRIYDETNDDN